MRMPAVSIMLLLLASANANAKMPDAGAPADSAVPNGCPEGSYSVVNAPDGSALSILFDGFSIAAGPRADGVVLRKVCNIQVPLQLPDGYSLGVYRVDYRGFAHLDPTQTAELNVAYALGLQSNGRRFQRGIRGAHDGDFAFTENIGAGLMRRVGCGDAAVLNVAATLELQAGRQPSGALVALDSVDGAPKGGLVYRFNLKKCGP